VGASQISWGNGSRPDLEKLLLEPFVRPLIPEAVHPVSWALSGTIKGITEHIVTWKRSVVSTGRLVS